MNKRIEHLSESPCYQCGKLKECEKIIDRCPALKDIVDCVMPRADFDYHKCSIWNALVLENEHG